MAPSLENFDAALDRVERALQPFLAVPLKTLSAEVSAVEAARLNVAYGYALTSLMFSKLRCRAAVSLLLRLTA